MEEFRELFILLKEYIHKQKENIALGATEGMTILLSVAATGFILIMLGSIVLLLGGFALAFWIGELTDSAAFGFGILAGATLLLAIVFWFKRKQWVLQPIARLMVQIFLEDRHNGNDNDSKQQK
ncbi:MAG: phage holin family protein [Bacteroidaceae bacterium]|nr:phage holin family protein [Bacteroidaceae bacterium]